MSQQDKNGNNDVNLSISFLRKDGKVNVTYEPINKIPEINSMIITDFGKEKEYRIYMRGDQKTIEGIKNINGIEIRRDNDTVYGFTTFSNVIEYSTEIDLNYLGSEEFTKLVNLKEQEK